MTALLPREVVCRKLVEVITGYLEGRLSIEDRTRFEQHVVTCAGCTAYVEQMRQTIALAGAAREPDAPAEQEELLRMFRAWKEGR